MPSQIAQLGMQLAGNVANSLAGGALGMIFGRHEDRRQLRQARKLQELSTQGQMQMGYFNLERQLDLWKRTNYPAQMEMLKAAGLNPGLIYGLSGGGGTTAAATPGTVHGQIGPTTGGESIAMASQMAQLGLMSAQKKVLESQAYLNTVTADKTKGTDTEESQTRIKDIIQTIENKKAQEKLTNVQTNILKIDELIKSKTQEDLIDEIQWRALKSLEELTQSQQETYIKRATALDIINEIKTKSAGAILQNLLTKANIDKTYSEINKWAVELTQEWENISIREKEMTIKDKEAQIKAFLAKFTEKHPSLHQVAGKMINAAAEALTAIFSRASGGNFHSKTYHGYEPELPK